MSRRIVQVKIVRQRHQLVEKLGAHLKDNITGHEGNIIIAHEGSDTPKQEDQHDEDREPVLGFLVLVLDGIDDVLDQLGCRPFGLGIDKKADYAQQKRNPVFTGIAQQAPVDLNAGLIGGNGHQGDSLEIRVLIFRLTKPICPATSMTVTTA